MITLTDTAANQVQMLLEQQGKKGAGLRIFVQGGGCAGFQYGLKLEEQVGEQDTVVENKGVRLFVDPFSAGLLEGACLDYVDTMLDSGFRVDNPNAAATCACGSSFRTEGDEQVEETCQPEG
jgi:iron-sulfur cluster assembly accessory protein